MPSPLALSQIAPWFAFLAAVALPVIAFAKLATSIKYLANSVEDLTTALRGQDERLRKIEQDMAFLRGRQKA